jgi:hypothetical protein
MTAENTECSSCSRDLFSEFSSLVEKKPTTNIVYFIILLLPLNVVWNEMECQPISFL